jgi:hypothetical protein
MPSEKRTTQPELSVLPRPGGLGAAGKYESEDPDELIFSPELGEVLPKAAAIREKLRLYPLAQSQEIAAMFEYDGVAVSAHLVQRIQQEVKSEYH